MAKIKIIIIHARNAMKQDPSFVCGGKESLKCPRFTFVEYFQSNTILIGEESVSLLHLMISIIHIFEYQ